MVERISEVLTVVREKLQADGIRLWLEPYHIDGLGSCDDAIAVRIVTLVAINIYCRREVCFLPHHVSNTHVVACYQHTRMANRKIEHAGASGVAVFLNTHACMIMMRV